MITNLSANEAWKAIIDKYGICERVEKDGVFYISANQIKEFKEPRLMAKWDSSDSLPSILKEKKLNILPDSRSSYVIGDFLLYEPIPELTEKVEEMKCVRLPDYETIDVKNINSEANAINVLILSGILDDFLGSKETVETFNGRMGTGEFDFAVNTVRGKKRQVSVKNAQCEIDGGFENAENVIIMEAKNVLHEDFHIRQLYYPYRLWERKVNKPIRLVFTIYSNMIYRLFEYEFEDLNDYSSIKLIRSKNYSLQDTTVTIEDIIDTRAKTAVIYEDNQEDESLPPFIQADSFERVISLLENLKDNPMTTEQIAELMDFEPRQSDYYYNAGKYLRLFEKKNEDGQKRVRLTELGEKVFALNYKERQLKFVELIVSHRIFADCFDIVINNAGRQLPERGFIENRMRELNVCNEPQINRRAGSVLGWLKWIFNLTNL